MDDHNPPMPAADLIGARSASALRELQERAQAAIAARREQAAQLETDITAHLDAIATALTDGETTKTTDSGEADQARSEAQRATQELEDALNSMKLERAAWESEREALEKERAAAETERSRFAAERANWETDRSTFESQKSSWEVERSDHTIERRSWEAERSAWEAERNKLTASAARWEAEVKTAEAEQKTAAETERAAQADSRKQVADLERKLLDDRAAHDRELEGWAKERADFNAQLDESRQKFELALEDVQRLRGKVTDLEQELARRPETEKADSAELVALRAERDVLAARVEQLEQAPAGRVDADTEQELTDLRRRFELAVEDVRELKSKNVKLETQLAESKRQSSHKPDGDGMDWESQKRRLLASLEGGGDGEEEVDAKERATIESTIEMTDAVISEKDQLIAALQAQLESSGEHKLAAAQAEREAEVEKLLDSDDVIAEHRRKIAQHEQEMEAKLRAAELELSVERAKIARQRAELEELRVELESQRHTQGHHDSQANPGAPKRRWLSKLGLSGEEDT